MTIEIPLRLAPEFEAVHVPVPRFSQPDKITLCQVTWNLHMKRNGHSLVTEYHQGIGHVKSVDISRGMSVAAADGIRACIAGRNKRGLTYPTVTDAIYANISDIDACEYASFEEWAGDAGFDTDSRSAEKIFNECVARGRIFKLMYSQDELAELHDMFLDY